MDDDPWRNPFAESLKEGPSPAEANSSKAFEWRSSVVDAVELDIGSSTFQPPAWDAGIDHSNTVEWTPALQHSTTDWEATSLEGPGWTSYAVDAGEDVAVHVPESRITTQDVPETPTMGSATWAESIPRSPSPVLHADADDISPFQSVPAPVLSPSPPLSPDPFGTFESANTTQEEDPSNTWGSSTMLEVTDTADPWGSTWAESSPYPGKEVPDPPKDEWEAAAAVKQQRDNVVAPQDLNAWIEQLETAVEGLWPPLKDEELDRNWRISLQDADGVSFLSKAFLPELRLSRPLPYTQTAISKSSVTALKLTRHLPLARSSPLSILRTQKEATSWEQSVKRDPKRESVDWGWMVSPTDASTTGSQEAQAEVKKPGGIFSFLGRKTAAVVPLAAPAVPAAAEQVNNTSRTSSPAPAASARASIDTAAPSVPETASVRSASPTPTSPPSPSIPPIPPSPPTSSPVNPQPIVKSVAPEVPTLTADTPATSAPSAVTRFLSRFSRKKSDDSAHKPLSLSVSDMSFLEDTAPTGHAHDVDVFDGFSIDDANNESLLSSKSRSSHVSPLAPLASPPQPSITPPNTAASLAPSSSPASKVEDDIWNVFAAPPPTQQLPSTLPSHLKGRASPSRATSPLPNTLPAIPRKSITPKMVPSTTSPGSIASLLPSARSASPLAAPKTLITDIPRAPSSQSASLSASSSFGQPYLDETMARTDPYAVNPQMYDMTLHSTGPDEAFDLFGDFTDSTPKPSASTLLPTPPSKSPSRAYSGGSVARGSLPNRTPIRQSDATRPTSVSSSILSASTTRKGSGLNFDFLRSEMPKPNVQVSASAHRNGIASPVATVPRPSQSPPLRPLSQTFSTSSSLAPQGRMTSPPPSAPSIDLMSSFGTMSVQAPPKPPTTNSQGGLSAQDLSFFENL